MAAYRSQILGCSELWLSLYVALCMITIKLDWFNYVTEEVINNSMVVVLLK